MSICQIGYSAVVRTLERTGFEERFFEQSRIDAIHVIARSNEWYQNDEILEICKAVAAITQNYERVYTYGSSMGGYAAIRFGKHVGARAAIALSPKFSVDKAVVPVEHRWIRIEGDHADRRVETRDRARDKISAPENVVGHEALSGPTRSA